MKGILCVLWEKYVEFKYEWRRITAAAVVSPIMYLIAFGWGLGEKMVDGRPYVQFLIPGIIALSTMNNSFSSVGTSLNVQRIFEKSFKQIVISPTPWWQYIVGQILGGALRGMYAGCLLILIVTLFRGGLYVSPMFFLVMLLNGMVFSALGVVAAMKAKTHSDISRFSTFVIMPMTFLCNTFFPLDKIPPWANWIIQILPLSHASKLLRSISYRTNLSLISFLVLGGYCVLFFVMALNISKRAKTL